MVAVITKLFHFYIQSLFFSETWYIKRYNSWNRLVCLYMPLEEDTECMHQGAPFRPHPIWGFHGPRHLCPHCPLGRFHPGRLVNRPVKQPGSLRAWALRIQCFASSLSLFTVVYYGVAIATTLRSNVTGLTHSPFIAQI